MTGAPTIFAIASALAVVLQFGVLRAPRPAAALNLVRLHVAATAVAAGASALADGVATVETGVLLAGAVVLAGLALRVRGVLHRLDARTGGAPAGASAASMWAVPSIAAALGLTALAVLAISGSHGSAAGVQRQTMAFGLASVLLGLLSACRSGPPAPTLARLVVLGDGLILLACAVRADVELMAAALLLTPCMLAVAGSVLGRAGGLPASQEDGWR